MKIQAVLLLSVLLLAGCNSTSTAGNALRAYSGTASVGDFLRITLDPAAHTLSYTNVSNGDAGIVPYAVNVDGTYTLQDPQGVLVAAYEVPNFGMIVQAAKAGPNHNMSALITAVARGGNISPTTWANQDFNYMQFRTAAGGMEIGSANMNSAGDVSITHFWPYGDASGQSGFGGGSFNASSFVTDPSGEFMTLPDNNGGAPDYVFGTPGGVFAVDTNNGAIIGLKKANTKDFDPAVAGVYKAIYYQKTGAQTGQGNVETGTPSLGNATITIGANGQIKVQSGLSTLVQTTLEPVADVPYLYGTNELTDPCFGLFTFRITTQNARQDVFVAFMDHTILFASFTGALPPSQSNPYDYLYGVGLK